MAASSAIDTGAAFRPHVLREYALLADGERGALIGPHGEITWMCAPRWDSDAVFSALIGGGGGYAVTPADERHVWGGYYEPGSLIWRSRWITGDGVIESREALAFPGDPDRVVLLRRIIATRGPARVRVLLDPQARFGRDGGDDLARHDDGVWTGRTGPLRWRWTGAGDAKPHRANHGRGEVLAAELAIPAGGHHDLVLELAEKGLPEAGPEAGREWAATEAAWARARPVLANSIASRDAHHAWAVLRGLTSGGGGMVAAATMSLPERAEADRNYDYRYAWIRDQSYAGLAAAAVGATDLLDGAVAFITQRLLADGPQLKPAYAVDGGPVPSEQSLDLPGYPGGTDKIGNWVNQQFQLDAFGESLQLLAAAAREGMLDTDAERAIHTAVEAIERRWTDDDAGIWEVGNRPWTQSRLACVAGLRAIAGTPAAGADVTRCTSLADAILARTAGTSLHADGHWLRQPGQDGTDASLLLPPVRGALPADDPRTVATLHAVRRELSRDYYVYRFRHDQRDLGAAEGAFLLCGFMMALAEHHHGDPVRAVRYFERNRAACGPAGLLSEEYDITQRQLRGNLPQAFVHALLLECAARLTGDRSGLSHCPAEQRDQRNYEESRLFMTQTVVITGASAGIGRATAKAFGQQGANVILLARGEAGLAGAARDVEQGGGKALPVPCDVADYSAVDAAAQQAEDHFGPIDTWINVAFTSVFAPFTEIKPEEFRRVTEVSYLGFVYGTMAALARMKPRDRGTIVQVGSALGGRSIPLQSAYCGAKHAINGFTESVRCELLHEGSNVRITVAQMPAVNTPQFSWVLSRLPRHPQPVPPIYQPELAAAGVVYAASHPQRKQYWVGDSTAATLLAQKFAAPLLDRYLARTGYDSQQTGERTPAGRPRNLWQPVDGPDGTDHGAHGAFDDRSHSRSPQLWVSHHARLASALTATAVAAGVLAAAARRAR